MTFKVGEKVVPVEPEKMLDYCDYYTLDSIGVVLDIWPEYHASLIVAWSDCGVVNHTPPSMLTRYDVAEEIEFWKGQE